MAKQVINIGSGANAKDGDPIRVAFDKVNQNFTELYNTDTSTQYHLGDDVQYVDVDPTSGIVVVQSGFDKSMPVYVKGGNCSDGGVGGDVYIEAGGAGLPNLGTTGVVGISGREVTIETDGGHVTTFTTGDGGNPYVTFPEYLEAQVGIQGSEIDALPGSNGIALGSFDGPVYLRSNAGNTGAIIWEFDKSGTINTPLLFPISFTAVLDEAHMVDSIPFSTSDGYWQFDVQFQVSQDGHVESILNNIFPILDNPGYLSGYTFRFTEADHGIPGYTFDITLNNVMLPGGAGWTANVGVSGAPVYPSTINTSGAIKLTSNNKSWTFGTDGKLYAPQGEGIGIVFEDGTVQYTAATGGNTSTGDLAFVTNAMYNYGGVIVENADLSHAATSALTLPHNGYNTPVQLANTYGAIQITAGADSIVKDWFFNGDGSLTLPKSGTINNTATTIPASGSIYTFTLDADGNQSSIDNTNEIWIPATSEASAVQPGWTVTFSNTYQVVVTVSEAGIAPPHMGQHRIAWDGNLSLGGVNVWPLTIQSTDYTAGSTTKSLELTPDGTTTWTLESDGSLTLPNGATIANNGLLKSAYPGSSEIAGVAADNDNNRAIAWIGGVRISTNRNTSEYSWSFGTDGSLAFPSGGGFAHGEIGQIKVDDANTGSLDFRDHNGRGFYTDGGGFTLRSNGTYSWHFDGDGILTIPYNNYLETTDANLKIGSQGSVTIRSNAATGGGTKSWVFGTDGRLTIPAAPVPTHSYGLPGDKAGMVAFDSSYIYYCTQNYVDNSTDIWVRVVWTGTNW